MIVRCLPVGKDAAGLTRYIFGQGKANEHTNQRIVAGSPELVGEWSGGSLSMAEATHLGRVVEASWRRQYAPGLAMAGVGSGGVTRANLAGSADGQAHVFHAALSLHPDHVPLTDDQWQEVANRYVEAMGFTGVDDKPDCSWYAAHHGTSAEGNDHIHVVVCATRRDGSRASLHDSGRRSQTARRDVLEKLPYVDQLHDQGRTLGAQTARSFTAAEHNIARERATRGEGSTTPDRVALHRVVRGAAADSRTEAEFINNVIKHPRMEIAAARWAPGSQNQDPTGYKVRMNDGAWFSASSLAPDLTLSKLRPRWASHESDHTRSYARALWAERALGEKREATRDVPAALRRATEGLRSANETIERLDPLDRAAWEQVSSSTAGITAVIATAPDRGLDAAGKERGFGRDAGRASDVIARQWLADQEPRGERGPTVPTGLSGLEVATRHIQLAVRASTTSQFSGWLAVTQQLMRTMHAIAQARQARGEHVAAHTLRRDAIGAMERLEAWLDTPSRPTAADAPDAEHSAVSANLSPAAAAAREAADHSRRVPGAGEGARTGSSARTETPSVRPPRDRPRGPKRT